MERERRLLRIERKDRPSDRTTLKLAGHLDGSELGTLLETVNACLDTGHSLELDLANLRFLDEQAARLLVALRDRGAQLTRPSGYTLALLQAMEEES